MILKKYETLCQDVMSCFKSGRQAKYYLTHGGCFWFARFVCDRIENAELMISRRLQHCAVGIDGKVYDITGRLDAKWFMPASNSDIQYMRKHFVPCFNIQEIERRLRENE